jgi:hypothetical protein
MRSLGYGAEIFISSFTWGGDFAAALERAIARSRSVLIEAKAVEPSEAE